MAPTPTLSPSTIEIVKSTVPVLRVHKGEIILRFYELLFSRYPQVVAYFNKDRQNGGVSTEDGLPTQVSRLANAVMAYAKNIDKIEQIIPAITRIAHRHVSRGVVAPQYNAVGECLLAAMAEILGDGATGEFMTAWAEAYKFLAYTFTELEKDLKKQLEEKAGYSGYVDMQIKSVSQGVLGSIMSLSPNKYAVPPHGKGQFVAIKLLLENGEYTTTSMNIVSDGGDAIEIVVPPNQERATRALRKMGEGSIISVSVPCGTPK